MRMKNVFGFLLSLLTLVIVGCGGGGGGTPADPNAPASVTLTSSTATPSINTSATLTANVLKADGTPVANGTVVTFTVSAGTLSAVTTTTNGVATATLGGIAAPQTVTITAKAGGVSSPVLSVNFMDPNSPLSITMTGVPSAGVINSPVTITANVVKVAGGPVAIGTTVTFAITSGPGTLSSASATTDVNGNAVVTLNSALVGSTLVTATAAPATGSITIAFTNPNAPGAVQVTASKPLAIADGVDTVTFTATVSPAGVGGVIPNGTVVNFTTTGGTLAGATTTNNGVATVSLTNAVFAAAPFARDVTVTATVAGGVTGNAISRFVNQPVTAAVSVSLNRALGPISNLTFDVFNGDASTTFIDDSIVQNPAPITFAIAGNLAGSPNTVRVALISLNITIPATTNMLTLVYNVPAGAVPKLFTIASASAKAPDGITVVPVAVGDFNAPSVVLKDIGGNIVTP